MTEKKVILYADDDIDDRTWASDACRAVGHAIQMQFVDTGRQVLDYLERQLGPLPSLIVLDLNMPGMDGRQTLKQLKENPGFQHIPVIMVTNSINRIDKDVCRRLGAALLLTKPYTLGEWQELIINLQSYAA